MGKIRHPVPKKAIAYLILRHNSRSDPDSRSNKLGDHILEATKLLFITKLIVLFKPQLKSAMSAFVSNPRLGPLEFHIPLAT